MRTLSSALTTEQQKASATPYIKLTFESRGVLAEDCEDAWVASGNVTCTADTDRCLGSKSAKQAIVGSDGFGTGLASYEDLASTIDITSYTYISLWIKSSRAQAAGDLQIIIDEDTGCGGGVGSQEILDVPALTANKWTRVHLEITTPANFNALASVGLNIATDHNADYDVYLDDLRATVVYEYTTKDSPNRIFSIDPHTETPYDGFATVKLQNNDEHFSAKDLRGNRLWINYGFDISGTPEYSEAPPLWVRYQRITSAEGVLVCELDCMDIWRKLQHLRIMGDAAGASPSYERDTTVEGILIDLLDGVAVVSDMSIDCDASNLCTTETPLIDDLETNMAIIDVIARAISITKCGLRMRHDKLYSIYLADPDDTNDVYIYELPLSSEHVFRADVWEQGLVLPNNVIFVDTLPGAEGTTHEFSGSSSEATSVAAFGNVTRIFQDPTIRGNTEAGNRAAAMIVRLKNQQNQGGLRVPMNVGQELHDVLKIVDGRMNKTVYGRVGRIERRYIPDQNIYDLTMNLGGVTAPMDADGVAIQRRTDAPFDWATIRHFGGQTGHAWLWYGDSATGLGEFTAGGGASSLDATGLHLSTGVGVASQVQRYKIEYYSAPTMTWAQRRRFKTAFHVVTVNAHSGLKFYAVTGNSAAGFCFGFRMQGGVIKGFCSTNFPNQTFSDWSVNAASDTIYILEAAFYPGKYVEFWIDNVYKGRITTNLPSGASGYNCPMILELENGVSEIDLSVDLQNWLYVEGK